MCCSVLRCAHRRSELTGRRSYIYVLRCVAVCCVALQCVAVCCSTYLELLDEEKIAFASAVEHCCLHLVAHLLQCCSQRLVALLQCVAVCCSVLQCVVKDSSPCCSVLQCCCEGPVALLQCVAVLFGRTRRPVAALQCCCEGLVALLQHIEVCCSIVMKDASPCCSVLQCVAVCCSVLQCIPAWLRTRRPVE